MSSFIDCAIAPLPPIVSAETPLFNALEQMSRSYSYCVLAPQPDKKSALAEPSTCLLVMDRGILQGIITERDIVRYIAQNSDFETLRVVDIMTPNPVVIRRSQLNNIVAVLNIFRDGGFRHLPLSNDNGEIIGIITPNSLRQFLQPTDLLKMRSVSEVMTSEVARISATESLSRVVYWLNAYRVSCMVVTENQPNIGIKPIGIITERDIVQFQALRLNFDNISVFQVMSCPIFQLQVDKTLWEAHQTMNHHRIRRLPIVDEKGGLCGILTQTSILKALDPVELYETIRILKMQIAQLEMEKCQILQENPINRQNIS